MLIATLDQERKKIYQQGKAAGVVEGEAVGLVKGRLETQRQTLERLLPFRFDLAEADQRQLVQQLAQLQDVQQLDELVNILLNKSAALADFTMLLATYLLLNKPNA